MASYNKVQLIGNLGRDPELRHTTQNRTPVATLSVATTFQDATEWHRVVVWDKLAELCALHLAKGRSVFVEGRLQTRTWEDANKQRHSSVEIVASTVQFLGAPPPKDVSASSTASAASAAEMVRKAEAWAEIPF